MNYRLINKKSKEGTICSKIELDGFDYYVGKEISVGSIFIANQGLFKCIEIVDGNYPYKSYLLSDKNNIQWHSKNWKYKSAILATNNPNIDTPQVINEEIKIYCGVDYIKYESNETSAIDFMNGYVKGYNKAKETYQYTEKDMVEFVTWVKGYKFLDGKKPENEYTKEELLELWNNQRLVTIYYE